MDRDKYDPETTCGHCGSRVKVAGDETEGTHYYVPLAQDFVDSLGQDRRFMAFAERFQRDGKAGGSFADEIRAAAREEVFAS